MHVFILSNLLLIFLVMPSWSQSARHTVSGVVAEGVTGLEGIWVILSGTQEDTVTTNASGTFVFSDLADGSYTVFPESEDYTFSPSNLTFTLPTGSLTPIFDAVRTTNTDRTANDLPEVFSLDQNYPNPFRGSTTLRFQTFEPGFVRLSLWNVNGQLVNEIYDAWLPAQQHQVIYAPHAMTPGVYLLRLETSNYSQTRTLTIYR